MATTFYLPRHPRSLLSAQLALLAAEEILTLPRTAIVLYSTNCARVCIVPIIGGRLEIRMSDTMSEIKRRCKENDYLVWGVDEQLRIMERRLEEHSGDDTYAIFVNRGLHAEIALRSSFEKYQAIIRDYIGVWSPSLGVVECTVASVYDNAFTVHLSEEQLLQAVLRAFGKDAENMSAESRIRIPSSKGLHITLGPCSEAFAIHLDTLKYGMDLDAYYTLEEVMKRLE